MIEIEMFPAGEGDCFLITLIEADYRILIDGGIRETYVEYLKPRLLALASEDKKIDLLIVTHIDNDHIAGVIKLFEENGSYKDSKIICIEEVWYNSYRHLSIEKCDEIGAEEEEVLNAIISRESILEKQSICNGERKISACQGVTLAWLLDIGKYNWNSFYSGQAIQSNSNRGIQLKPDINMKVISPTSNELDRLRNYWKSHLKKEKFNFGFSKGIIFDKAFELYFRNFLVKECGFERAISSGRKSEWNFDELLNLKCEKDSSPTNNSSISFILKYKEAKLLFLGDFNTANLMLEDDDSEFDVIKLPHHGSEKNIDNAFLKKYYSKYYLFSTDGVKHGHPDLSVLAKIMALKFKKEKVLIFNYNQERVKEFIESNKDNKYHCNFIFPEVSKSTVINL